MSRRAARIKTRGGPPAAAESATDARPPRRPERGGRHPEIQAPVDEAAVLGERLRRYALGLTAALLTCRAYWPSEPDIRNGAGSGLTWILLLLLAAGLGFVSALVDGRLRIRRSWTDLAMIALVCLVGLSATHAIDRRPAINLAWEWIGIGIAYLLVRNLPRKSEESAALAGTLVATAVAVSVYGLYQSTFELPALREAFLRNPAQILQDAGVAPGPASEAMFRDRLMGSNEIWSTFGLANSLAGFLVGPVVLSLGVLVWNLARKEGAGSRWVPVMQAAVPMLAMLVCLLLTKSRSAWLGLVIGMGVVFWQAGRILSRRLILSIFAGGVVVAVLFLVAGFAMGRIDLEVLTQSPMSLRYRLEYWQATWGVITDGAQTIAKTLGAATFWMGVGPGNFGPPYLLYKLPQASEEIQDPHNMILEVWSTAGIPAMVALLAALGFGLWNLLGPPRDSDNPDQAADETPRFAMPSAVPWVIVGSGFGWALVVVVGDLNPFAGDSFIRWLILGGSWLAAILLGRSLWVHSPLPAPLLGAGALAIMINLLAAGGIGIPTVALCLWTMIALGQNVREDRPCGVLRVVGARTSALTGLGIWAATVGVFLGAVVPYWNSEAAIASADAALRPEINPNFEGAKAALEKAIKADHYNSRPFRKLAGLELRAWQERGARPEDQRWKTIPYSLLLAVTFPRNPNVWSLHAERADVMTTILSRVGESLPPIEKVRYLGNIVEATRTASRLYPTNATLHARLAKASADISMFADAVSEATEALRLDKLTPHLDKKLPDLLRKKLEDELPGWKKRAEEMPIDIPR